MRTGFFCTKPIPCIAGIFLMLILCRCTAPAADNRLVELVARGDEADKKDDTRAALGDFLEAEKLSPRNAPLLVRISRQYSDLVEISKPGDAEKAARASLDYARRAVEADPRNAKAHLSLAIGHGKMTDYTDNKTKLEYSKIILAETEKSIALDPTDDFAYHVLGRWHYGIATLNPMLRLMARIVYGAMPQASLEDAETNLKKAAAIAPQRIIHHRELAHTYQAMGKNDLAAKEWETVLSLHATDQQDHDAQAEARKALNR
jgi:hypothetical protein